MKKIRVAVGKTGWGAEISVAGNLQKMQWFFTAV